jgi:CRP-like cAMP-binding protein
MSQSPNLILSSLPKNIFAAIEPHLQRVKLTFGGVIAEPDKPISKVYFPFSGVISLVVHMDVGPMIETAMVGRDGVANALSALDKDISLHKGIIQVHGEAATIDPDVIRRFTVEHESLRAILIRHEQVLLAQTQQSAGCNASHTVETRMCRWLLRMRDLTGSDELALTQEFLAQMLGVQRSSVSLVANTLQRAGLITYKRGNIRLLDVPQLMDGACECYATVKRHYDHMLAM